MAKPPIREKDRGLGKIAAAVRSLGGASVKVGVLGSAKDVEPGLSQALVASVHEYGSDDGHIPERSFLRSSVEDNRARIGEQLDGAAASVIDLKQTSDQALGRLGLWFQSTVRRKITQGPFVPNAPSTIERKGTSRPLIDNGELRRSIDFEVVSGKEAGRIIDQARTADVGTGPNVTGGGS